MSKTLIQQEQYITLAKKIEQETWFSEELSLSAATSIINTEQWARTYTLEDVYKGIFNKKETVQYV